MELLAGLALFIVETLIPIVVEVALGLILEVFPELPEGSSKRARRISKFCFVVVVGALLGWVSTLFLPSLLLKTPALQLLNLFVSPILAGFLVERISMFFLRGEREHLRFGDFWTYFWFTLAFLAMRVEVYYKDLWF